MTTPTRLRWAADREVIAHDRHRLDVERSMDEIKQSIYLSSTLADLDGHREHVRLALSRRYVVNDSYSAASGSLIESCLQDVRNASVYVGLFAFRYGYIPVHSKLNPDGLSITELEYRCARDAKIPCFIFLGDEQGKWKLADVDKDRKNIDRLREAVKEQRPALFDSQDDLLRKVSEAVNDHFERERECARANLRAKAPSMDPEAQAPHPRQLKHASLLLYVQGPDEAAARLLANTLQGEHLLRLLPIVPEDPPSLAAVDAALSTCRSACLLISRSSLPRFKSLANPLKSWLELIRNQVGTCMLLTDRVEGHDLGILQQPDAGMPQFDLGAWLAVGTPTLAEPLTNFLTEMKHHFFDFERQDLVGLPYLIVAMNQVEAGALAERVPPAGGARGFTNDDYLTTLIRWFDDQKIEWTQRYGEKRNLFRPFGEKTAFELLRGIVREINDQLVVPKRDRENLRGNQIRLREYAFDPRHARDDEHKNMYAQMKRNGCLVIADELSLCQDELRKAASTFFDDRSVSVVTLAPRDPLIWPFEAVTDLMNIGNLVARFRDRLDLRCELAVVSHAGLRRWLRFSVPETLGFTELDSADPDRRAQFRLEAFA